MKQVIYADGVVTKLQALRDEFDNKYGNKKSVDILRKITGRLDDLGRFNSGESTKDRFGIDSDYMVIYGYHNFFFYLEQDDRIVILEMFNEREDFIYVLFGIPMRSHESIDYWGE